MAQRHDAIGDAESNLIRSNVFTILAQRPAGTDLFAPIGQTETKTRVRTFILALVFIKLFLLGQRTSPTFREVRQNRSRVLVILPSKSFQGTLWQCSPSVPFL
jgi:hypothetical protein